MMQNVSKDHVFYYEFKETNVALIMGLTLVTLGTYIIPWIYTKNKEFALLDDDAPNENRGPIILMLLPFIWGYGGYVFSKLVFVNPITISIQIVGWSFIIFLALKYLWDFCASFARITRTRTFAWFILFIFLPIGVAAMQAEINSHFHRINIRKKYHGLYKTQK